MNLLRLPMLHGFKRSSNSLTVDEIKHVEMRITRLPRAGFKRLTDFSWSLYNTESLRWENALSYERKLAKWGEGTKKYTLLFSHCHV